MKTHHLHTLVELRGPMRVGGTQQKATSWGGRQKREERRNQKMCRNLAGEGRNGLGKLSGGLESNTFIFRGEKLRPQPGSQEGTEVGPGSRQGGRRHGQ